MGGIALKLQLCIDALQIPLGNYAWTSRKVKYPSKWSNLKTKPSDCKMKSRGQEKLRNLFGIIQRRKASNESQVSWSLTQRSFHFSILPPSLKTKDWMGQTGLEKQSIVLIKQSSRAFLFSALPSRTRGGPIFNVSCIVRMKMMLPGNSISIPCPACPRSHLPSSLGRHRFF